MKHILHIPDYTPISLNTFANKHWAVRKRAKDADRELIIYHTNEQDIPQATSKRKVSLYIVVEKGQKRPDEDNIKKCLFDSLVSAGVLQDDSPRWCQVGPVHWARGERRDTFVILEDV